MVISAEPRSYEDKDGHSYTAYPSPSWPPTAVPMSTAMTRAP
ncbi:MAG: hypothetical protein ACLSAF_08610 [Intestinimonas sp.]